jgi:hypothetical protein
MSCQALKARDSKAQGEGREAAEALGWNENESQALKGRDNFPVSPLQGLTLCHYDPRVPEPASRSLPPWALLFRPCRASFFFPIQGLFPPGLCCRVPSVVRISLTRMPSRALYYRLFPGARKKRSPPAILPRPSGAKISTSESRIRTSEGFVDCCPCSKQTLESLARPGSNSLVSEEIRTD